MQLGLMKREHWHNFKYTEVHNARKFFNRLHNKIHKLQQIRELTIVTVTQVFSIFVLPLVASLASFDACAISLPEAKGLVTDTPHFTTKTHDLNAMSLPHTTHNYKTRRTSKVSRTRRFLCQNNSFIISKKTPAASNRFLYFVSDSPITILLF